MTKNYDYETEIGEVATREVTIALELIMVLQGSVSQVP